jgi:diguanylate cyclase (GGDEF)-like protein/PAS domain S-box-containing protein
MDADQMRLRSRLLLLVILATSVPAMFLGIRFFQTRAAEVQSALAGLTTQADNIADDLDDKIQGTAQLEYGLARTHDLDSSNRAECSSFLSAVREEYLQYTGILTILPDGSLFCDSLQSGRDLDLRDRGYFQKALVTKDAVTLQPVTGRLTGISVLQIAYPAHSVSGQLKYVLLASFNLQKFWHLHSQLLSNAVDILLLSKDGIVLASPSDRSWTNRTGTSIANTDLFRFASDQAGVSSKEVTGIDGSKQFWAAVSTPALRDAGLYVMVGISKDRLVAAADQRLYEALAIVGVVFLVLFAGVWMLAEIGVRHPVGRIAAMAKSLGSGDLSVRIASPYPAGELGGLMVDFNVAAESLQRQHTAIDDLNQKLSQSQQTEARTKIFLDTVIEHIPNSIAVKKADSTQNVRDWQVTLVNKAYEELTGLSRSKLIGKSLRDLYPEEVASLMAAADEDALESNTAVVPREISLVTPKKDVRVVTLRKVAIRDEDGEAQHLLTVFDDVTEKRRSEDALRASEEEFRSLAESMPQIVWVTRPDGWNIYFNKQWMDYTGQTLEESMGHGWNKPFHPDDRQSAWDAWQNATKNNGIYSIESRLRGVDGTYRWWLVRGVPLFADGGNILKWFGTCTDIHDLKIAEQALTASERKLQTALTNMSQGLCLFDADDKLILFNPRYAEIFGIPPEKIMQGMSPHQMIGLAYAYKGAMDADADDTADRQAAIIGDAKAGSTVERLRDGRSISISHRPVPDGGSLATFEDVTERIRIEERIRHLAHYDSLTDLPNRVLFREQLEQALKWIHRGEEVAVLYLDLDHFKTVNDSLGHPVGDELLKAVSGRLRACLRDTDSVARLGGDEFAIIQTAIKIPADVSDLVTRIFAALKAPFDVNGHQLLANTSIGIAVAPGDGVDPDQLLKNADLAMYGAKADGRGIYRFFEPDMDARVKARRVLELDLREAIQRFEFELHYQPIVNLQNNTISGCEALVRWRHPTRGMVSPADFIPIAEETGLIVPIGEWVLRTACAQAATWPDNIKIAVNVSPVQFKNGFVQLVVNALATSGLTPRRLELEITEAVLIHDDTEALALLHQLREIGVRIAMDDFGTGYSSLSYLQRFPFDKIKIDQSFIKGVEGSVDQQSIVQAVMTIAKTRNMTTTAEGVETEQQREILRTLGCTELQGYLVSPPVPAAKMTELIHSDRKMDARVA